MPNDVTQRNKVRPANPWWQRWQRRWRAWRGAGDLKTHRVELIDHEGERFKRVGFTSPDAAADCARLLDQVAILDRFPRLRSIKANDVEVDYIDGPLARQGHDDADLLGFFVDLYVGPGACRVSQADSGLLPALEADLRFLVEQRLVDSARRDALWQAAQQCAPDSLWLGIDYIDPVLKNFVRRADGRVIAIDIEALLDRQALGSGLAKARLRWLRGDSDCVLRQVAAKGGPVLSEQYRLVEVAFLAAYFRQKVIQKKSRHLRLKAFQRWLDEA